METGQNYLNELQTKLQAKVPVEQIETIWKENEQVLTAAGGAFLVVTGLKFVSNTLGFLMVTGGALLLYKGLMGIPSVKKVLDNVAENAERSTESAPSRIFTDAEV